MAAPVPPAAQAPPAGGLVPAAALVPPPPAPLLPAAVPAVPGAVPQPLYAKQYIRENDYAKTCIVIGSSKVTAGTHPHTHLIGCIFKRAARYMVAFREREPGEHQRTWFQKGWHWYHAAEIVSAYHEANWLHQNNVPDLRMWKYIGPDTTFRIGRYFNELVANGQQAAAAVFDEALDPLPDLLPAEAQAQWNGAKNVGPWQGPGNFM